MTWQVRIGVLLVAAVAAAGLGLAGCTTSGDGGERAEEPVTTSSEPAQDAGGEPAWVGLVHDAGGGATTIVTSDDLEAWMVAGTIDDAWITDLAHGDDGWRAVGRTAEMLADDGEASSVVLTSDDLETWTQVVEVEDLLASIEVADGTWLAAGADATGSPPTGPQTVWESSDGDTWTKAADLRGYYQGSPPPLAHGPDGWLTMASTFGDTLTLQPLTSPDGLRWSVTGGDLTEALIAGVASDGDGWWALVADPDAHPDGPTRLHRSDDATSWTAVEATGLPPASAELTSLLFGGGRWVASGQDGGTWTSTDGTTWTEVSTQPPEVAVVAVGP